MPASLLPCPCVIALSPSLSFTSPLPVFRKKLPVQQGGSCQTMLVLIYDGTKDVTNGGFLVFPKVEFFRKHLQIKIMEVSLALSEA